MELTREQIEEGKRVHERYLRRDELTRANCDDGLLAIREFRLWVMEHVPALLAAAETVAGFAKTRDGVTIVPGMKVRVVGSDLAGNADRQDGSAEYVVGSVASDHAWLHLGGEGEPDCYDQNDIYSSESAARSAAGEVGNG